MVNKFSEQIIFLPNRIELNDSLGEPWRELTKTKIIWNLQLYGSYQITSRSK
jgi:hypothetical protein